MTVVLSRNDHWAPAKAKCSVCGDSQYHPPYVYWNTFASEAECSGDLIFCPRCCRGLLHGLVADMIHAVAIADIRALGYHSFTLVRAHQNGVDAEAKAVRENIK
jgi:hypothetical protein